MIIVNTFRTYPFPLQPRHTNPLYNRQKGAKENHSTFFYFSKSFATAAAGFGSRAELLHRLQGFAAGARATFLFGTDRNQGSHETHTAVVAELGDTLLLLAELVVAAAVVGGCSTRQPEHLTWFENHGRDATSPNYHSESKEGNVIE